MYRPSPAMKRNVFSSSQMASRDLSQTDRLDFAASAIASYVSGLPADCLMYCPSPAMKRNVCSSS